MSGTDPLHEELERFFEAGRTHGASPDEAFSKQLLEDALTAQPAVPSLGRPNRRGKARWFGAIGGWPALTGLLTATVAGVWIGAVAPIEIANFALGSAGPDYGFADFTNSFALGEDDG